MHPKNASIVAPSADPTSSDLSENLGNTPRTSFSIPSKSAAFSTEFPDIHVHDNR